MNRLPDGTRPDPEEELTLAQASKETGLSHTTLKVQIRLDRIKAVLEHDSPLRPFGTGDIYLVKRKDLDAYIRSRRGTRMATIKPSYVPSIPLDGEDDTVYQEAVEA